LELEYNPFLRLPLEASVKLGQARKIASETFPGSQVEIIVGFMRNSALQHWQDRTNYDVVRSDAYLRLQSVVVFVRDQDQSLKFYVDQLGFSVTFDSRF